VTEVELPRDQKIARAKYRSEKSKGTIRVQLKGECFAFEGGKLVEYEYLLSGYAEET
jgi:hypothetical protein